MPRHSNRSKTAKKRTKVIAAQTLRNKIFKTNFKTIIKKYEAVAAPKNKAVVDMAAADLTYRAAVKKIDQAVARGIMHKNKAARKKSQFAKKFASLK